ncbi:MAG TPA: caspase family protein [Allosphingosinicella sp.]|jgi:hypothetical protein|nr:caspase family protein [Allosphingosinicella sp.]
MTNYIVICRNGLSNAAEAILSDVQEPFTVRVESDEGITYCDSKIGTISRSAWSKVKQDVRGTFQAKSVAGMPKTRLARRPSRLLRIAISGWAVFFAAQPLAAQGSILPASQGIQPPERRAFVVGIPVYDRYPAVNGARNDVPAIRRALARLDFKVTVAVTRRGEPEGRIDLESFIEQLTAFVATIEPGDTVMVYFSGHGIERNGINYLVPSSFQYDPGDLGGHAIPLNHLMRTIEDTGARLMILVLDACRTDTLPKIPNVDQLSGEALRAAIVAATPPTELVGTRSDDSLQGGAGPADGGDTLVAGLSPVPGSSRLLIAYAAEARRPSFGGHGGDPPGTPSFYTRHLAQAIVQPGLTLERILNEVSRQVSYDTGKAQIPWASDPGFPDGDLVFNPTAEQRQGMEKRWRLTRQRTGSGAPDALCIFLKDYPENPYRNEAVRRLHALSPAMTELC